ncbi:hypothetical protein BDK51DRAFT_39661 [Blyttiomyces helicus]|uniref:Uncharacterized protein n=1 Tax=Blyttiomyces helicus TaxID=388810 RepID=A0A4P9WE28_9FUNG|nr:hypothetical protein BDK51DRAFT_39661 [Blyttiomyces helicus]|eukprot:RKO88626.1 hypothetical protein BDK51DRAFT_39661 [Blyttiomyces helicus]
MDVLNRPFRVARANTEISFLLPVPLGNLAESLKESLNARFQTDDDNNDLSELELTASFLNVALEHSPDNPPADWASLRVRLVAVVLNNLNSKFLKNTSIHVATRSLSPDRRRATSALLDACAGGRARAFAIFGGQGNVDDYFAELVRLHDVYEPIVRPFIAECAVTLAAHSSSAEAQRERATQIDVLEWLERPTSRPSTKSLLATHLSLPLIGLIQLLNYWVAFKILGVEPGYIRDRIVGRCIVS